MKAIDMVFPTEDRLPEVPRDDTRRTAVVNNRFHVGDDLEIQTVLWDDGSVDVWRIEGKSGKLLRLVPE